MKARGESSILVKVCFGEAATRRPIPRLISGEGRKPRPTRFCHWSQASQNAEPWSLGAPQCEQVGPCSLFRANSFSRSLSAHFFVASLDMLSFLDSHNRKLTRNHIARDFDENAALVKTYYADKQNSPMVITTAEMLHDVLVSALV